MKVNHKLQLATFFISMFMLTACGGSGDSTATPPVTPPVVTTPVTPPSQSLEGSWSTQCQASKALDGYDEQDTFNFKGNTLTTNKFFYQQNTNCKHSEEALRAREVAGIKLGAAVNPGTNTGHTKINITPTKIRLVAINSTFTALLNNSGHTSNESIYNGYGEAWSTNYWKDLSNITEAKNNFKIDQSVPDILQISQKMIDGTTHKVLKLGAKGGNVDSEGRPLVLARSITATLQKKTTPTQTAQNAGLIGQWKYGCVSTRFSSRQLQRETLDFEGNKLTTIIYFYFPSSAMQTQCNTDTGYSYQVKIDADIVVGTVINKGAANEHTEIGIKPTKVQMMIDDDSITYAFNITNLYNSGREDIYHGYGQKDWKAHEWKDVSSIPNAIISFNIGTQVPDIFKISTATDGHKELKMGGYKGHFDINGRAMSLEDKAAVLQ